MASEQRRGKLYYYRKRRDGGRVVSEYVGSGAVVVLAEYEAEQQRLEREAEQRRLEALKMSQGEIDAQVDSFCDTVELLVSAAMLVSGYGQHKGEWRKKRDGGKAQ